MREIVDCQVRSEIKPLITPLLPSSILSLRLSHCLSNSSTKLHLDKPSSSHKKTFETFIMGWFGGDSNEAQAFDQVT